MVRDRVNEANEAVIAIRRVKTQLDDRYESATTPGSGRPGTTPGQRVGGGGGHLPGPEPERAGSAQLPHQGQQPPGQPHVHGGAWDGRPGNMMPEIFDILTEELKGYTDRLERSGPRTWQR